MYTGNTSELFPFPPAHLMRLSVSWADNDRFLARGASSFAKLKDAFEMAGVSFEGKVLEWGCGCGRVIRHALAHGLDAYGCDINAEAIAWCKANLDAEKFEHCTVAPALPYPDQTFDFIYAGSVITHLSIDLQIEWFKELRRILKPGGHMLLTFAGTFHFKNYHGRADIIVRAINDQPYLEVGDHSEGSNAYGIAQTIGTLDIAAIGFERKSFIMAHDILGAQDTAVFQKVTNTEPSLFALLASEKALDRRKAALLKDGKEVGWVDGAIADQLFLIEIDPSLTGSNVSDFSTAVNFSLNKLIELRD